MEIKDYKINLYDCKNGHIKEKLLNEFEETQNIDLSHIKCDICKKNNKSISYNNIFYKCLICDKNICPLCKSERALFCFVWLCAIAGTIVSFLKLKEHSNMETVCFVGMGLSVLVAFKPLIDSVSTAAVIWIIAEGVCYITGAVFYSFNKVRYMHSVFHFFVLAGSVCHIIAVWDVLMSYL